MRCAKCGADNPGGKKFCSQCGSGLPSRCPKCGAENTPASRFCGDCGTALAGDATPAATRSAQIGSTAPNIRLTSEPPGTGTPDDGERKTVTALFADIKGSTELEQDLDPEDARAIVDPALKLMIDAVRRYDGYVVQSTGDGIFAMFGAPLAHEDHPQRAIHAAMRMQEEVRRYADRLRAQGRAPLQIRVGANTGEVVVRTIHTGEAKTEYTAIGHPVNLASRMQTLANPGSTVIAESTRKLVEGYFTLKSLGASLVKGVSEPVNVYEVTGLGPLRTRLHRSAGRGYSKFVGRGREMEAMHRALELARQGQGQLIAVIGEPGIGKSRLVSEFKARAGSECLVLEAFSVSYGKASAWLPVIDLLKGYFRITDDDDPRTRREKVGGKVLMLERSLEDALAPLLALLGIADYSQKLDDVPGFGDGEGAGRRLLVLNTVRRLLLRESLNQPLVLIFEDLHWIDGETQALLDALVESLASARILLLVNYRPEYRHDWGNKSYYTQVRLDPLGRESADEMLAAILGEGKDLLPLKRLIIEKTEGNPFFMEEIVQALFENGALVRDGEIKVARSLSRIQIPPTVQAILAARIDRLPSEQKDLLQTLAVIGREFAVRLVTKVTGKPDDELNRMLTSLQSSEFIYEQPATGDVEYGFKHALTLEVAYGSMLMERRKALHERAGAAIETLFSDRLEDHYSELAHHYGRSANREKAFEYCRLAGKGALAQYAYEEAIGHLRAGLELLGQLPSVRPRDELDIQQAFGWALAARSAPESAAAFSRARELCAITNAPATVMFDTLFGLFNSLVEQGKRRRAQEAAEEMLAVAERSGDAALVGRAAWGVGFMLVDAEPAEARPYFERALGSGANLSRSLTAIIASLLALCLQRLGYLDQALSRMRQAEQELAQGGIEPWYLAGSQNNAAIFYARLGDGVASLQHADASEPVAEKFGIGEWATVARSLRTFALALTGRREEALAMVRASVDNHPSASSRMKTMELLFLGEACVEGGFIEEGLGIVETLAAAFDGSGGRLTPVSQFVDFLKGRLLLIRNPPDLKTAEDCLRRAIEQSRAASEKFSELRCARALARVLCDTGRRDEARAMLAELYGWFTEGLDTRYLKETKALLDELNA